jgi:hypothetical protein
MRQRWLLMLWLLSATQGCGILELSRQVVVSPVDLDDYRSQAWTVRRVPLGARLPSENPED